VRIRKREKRLSPKTPPDVAFCRDLSLGHIGLDVVAHKRAYSRAFPKLYPWPKNGFSDHYGEFFDRAVRAANSQMGVKKTFISKSAHNALEKRHAKNKPTEWAFDSLAIKEAKTYCTSIAKQDIRNQIVEAAFFWYAHRMTIFYSMARPFQMRKPPLVPSHWDCSALAINCYYAGGAKDPSGRNYSGIGYTGDLWSRGRKVEHINRAQPGDLILYGFTTNPRPGFPYGSPTHVAVYNGNGMVISNGHYPMGYYTWNYRSVNSIVTFTL